ncbi:MAG: hypothetical protein D6688_13735 [Alphaproteobacteria bacterium]|nr:MAG: hypothetical protein D6688_13735 [Alphaproteobacteria bacterium]
MDGHRPRPDEIARIARRHFGAEVLRITAPGGAGRDSLRVHLPDRTVIATCRATPGRRDRERLVLKALSAAGAPVPRVLGVAEGVLFQEDLGRRRLSVELLRTSGGEVEAHAVAAIAALEAIRGAAARTDLPRRLRPIGTGPDWRAEFVAAPARLAATVGLRPPELDADRLLRLVGTGQRVIVKWDARPGNAVVRPDGSVAWFDWELVGLRHGVEDIAWLAADEFWPLGRQATLRAAERVGALRDDRGRRVLGLFAALHGARRLSLIARHRLAEGWIAAETALRYDRVGRAPDLARGLARRLVDWADADALTRPLVPFYKTVAGWFEAA